MPLSIMTLCHYAECDCAECRDVFIVMLSIIMSSIVMLNVIMLSVMAPYLQALVLADRANSPAYLATALATKNVGIDVSSPFKT